MSEINKDQQLSQTTVSGSADEVCMQQCESCEEEFDIETMIEGEQWFCRECYDELSKDEEFIKGTSYLDDDFEDDFQQCSSCDGHDACRDFGCAHKLGLGNMVQRTDL